MSKTTIIGDCETFPNCFQFCAEFVDAPVKLAFEISDRRDDSRSLYEFFCWVAKSGFRIAGFNWNGFDGPIIHLFMRMGGKATARTLYDKAQAIITSQDDDEGNRWIHSVKPTDRDFEWLDLYRIWHFDNKAKSTSLKILEFNMKMGNISDLPFPVGTVLDHSQMQVLMDYCQHDVSATKQFYSHSLPMIRFREELVVKYPGREWTAFNDTKIGKEYFTMQLEASGVQCFEYGPEGRQPRQTRRASIALHDAILPWIKFENPEFQRVLDWLRQQTITETKGVFTDVVARVGGIDVVFGLGGIHGSVESEIVESDADHMIVDIDVESYYPSTAIAQRFRPEHFPEGFCDIYAALKEQRKSYPKGTAENAMLKLALNGVYGDSNNPFSVFYDPLFTMRITLNGQLLLCLLAENLLKIDGLRIIQMNTDGLTVKLPRQHEQSLRQVVQWWEGITKLRMEFAEYRTMFIRDVNNYIALYTSGKVKRKGAYEHDLEWHQNHGALVVPKVAEQVLLHGAPIRETVEQWGNLYDFMLRTKVPRSSHLLHGEDRVQNVSRYVVSKNGKPLTKVMPPLAKNPGVWRSIGVESGWNVTICNDVRDVAGAQIEFDYYIREVEKLVNGLA